MHRFLLAPRRLALHAVALALVAAMTALGLWQLDRALATSGPPSAEPAPVPLNRLTVPGQLLPGQAYGRRVRLAGTFDGRHQTLVGDRVLDGRRGFWVLAPLRPRSGPAVAVVRGWVASRADVPPPPAEAVRVLGRVYPSERNAPGQGGVGVPVDTARLGTRLTYRLTDGYVVAVRQAPPAAGNLREVPAPPWPSKARGFPLQNAAYALQWWLFALFVCFMWWRVLRDQWRQQGASPAST